MHFESPAPRWRTRRFRPERVQPRCPGGGLRGIRDGGREMDSVRFDGLVRSFGQARSRRQTLRSLAAAGAALLLGLPVATTLADCQRQCEDKDNAEAKERCRADCRGDKRKPYPILDWFSWTPSNADLARCPA